VRILADENIEQLVIERLRDAGHTVISVRVESAGASDLPLLDRAVREDLLLLTADLDFGEYIFRDHRPPLPLVSSNSDWTTA
jgi:predicted nuclease of predicted toxin-antitoxin system